MNPEELLAIRDAGVARMRDRVKNPGPGFVPLPCQILEEVLTIEGIPTEDLTHEEQADLIADINEAYEDASQ